MEGTAGCHHKQVHMASELVSIVMSVYNADKYLAESIRSILSQTYCHFEFLIFDDGSSDRSREIIACYAGKDKRIVPVYSDVNAGYVVWLNRGIRAAKGDFIARMDADDIALPERIETELNFLLENSDVAITGSSCTTIDHSGEETGLSLRRASSEDLFWQSFFTNPLAHSTVMFRKSAIIDAGLYDPVKVPSEDYDLWIRVLRHSRIANLVSPLQKYREHTMSISSLQGSVQVRNSLETLIKHWEYFTKASVSLEVAFFFRGYHRGSELHALPAVRSAFFLIVKLYFKFLARYGYSSFVESDAFSKLLYLTLQSREKSVTVFLYQLGMLLLIFPKKVLFETGKRWTRR